MNERLAGSFMVIAVAVTTVKLPHRGSAAALMLLGEPAVPYVTQQKVARERA